MICSRLYVAHFPFYSSDASEDEGNEGRKKRGGHEAGGPVRKRDSGGQHDDSSDSQDQGGPGGVVQGESGSFIGPNPVGSISTVHLGYCDFAGEGQKPPIVTLCSDFTVPNSISDSESIIISKHRHSSRFVGDRLYLMSQKGLGRFACACARGRGLRSPGCGNTQPFQTLSET